MKSKLLFKILFFSISFFVISCDDRSYYPKIDESITVINKTDTLLYVEYDFETDLNFAKKDSAFSNASTIHYITNKTDYPWLRVSDFEAIISKIKIYRLEKNDTLFVNGNLYNKRSQWNYQLSPYFDSSTFANFNSINITPEMFNK
jgi:hypothetical protein